MTTERHTILIVDDDEEIVELLKDHFRRRNCETITTTDPLTVVDKLHNFQVKLMLLDLKMRALDGFDVLDKIKQAGLALPPTIIITGYLAKYRARLAEYGIAPEDVVNKPFSFETIENTINRKLGEQIVPAEVGSEYEDKIYEKNRCVIGLVEDEKDIRIYFSEFFSVRNYKVFTFGDGRSVLEFLKKEHLDILFVDMKLPGIQGPEIMEIIHRMPDPPAMIPISADPLTEELKKRFDRLDAPVFLEKPFSVFEVIELVKTVALKRGLLS